MQVILSREVLERIRLSMENIMGSVLKHSIFQMLLMNLLLPVRFLRLEKSMIPLQNIVFTLKVNNESERYIRN